MILEIVPVYFLRYCLEEPKSCPLCALIIKWQAQAGGSSQPLALVKQDTDTEARECVRLLHSYFKLLLKCRLATEALPNRTQH